MKKLLMLEEVSQFLLSIYILFQIPNHIGLVALLPAFFAPDVLAIGFLINNKTGTILYNIGHHKLIAISLVAIGYTTHSGIFLQVGVIMFTHICFDRAIGYGLKYMGNPSKTHMGFTGKLKHLNPPDSF